MTNLKADSKKLPILFLGYIILALGIVLTKKSDLGMAPWGVFHQGLSLLLGLSFGVVTQLLGVIILTLSVVLLKTRVGIGTILNVLVVGSFIDAIDYFLNFHPVNIAEQSVILILGLITMTFGRSLYISSTLGSGPRDGMFVGMSKAFNIEIKYMKPIIELTVLVIGYFLGGVVGYGTIILSLTSGYFVQYFFKLLKFDPKTSKQSSINEYILKKAK